MGGRPLVVSALALCWAGSSCVLSAKTTPCEGEACITEGDEVECEIADELPDDLAATCFGQIDDGLLGPNLRGFEPQFEQFTGTVDKRRWIYLPPGSSVDATDVDQWRFPTGTILWQEFASGDRIETQMLEKNGEGIGRGAWRASVYWWTADQTAAHRVKRAGGSYVVDALADWSEQDESSCMDCHQAPDDVVLGFTALQLSDITRQGSIDEWGEYLSSTAAPPAPIQIVGSPDDVRVLGALHANCGTCHSPRGIVGGLGLELNYSIASTTDIGSSNAMLTGLYRELRIVPTNVGGSNVYAMVNNGTMPPDRRTNLVDTGFRSALASWIAALEGPTAIAVDAPVVIDAEGIDGQTLLGYDSTVADEFQGTAFSRLDPYNFRSRAVTPVDTSLTYRVAGRFRSVGVTPSRIYYGLAPYDANGEFISAYRANRQGAMTTVVLASTTPTSITTTVAVDDWRQPETSGYLRAIGIYYDGDTTHLPDHVHINSDNPNETGPTVGAYSAATGTLITLNVELPEDVLAQISDQTVIANHYSGSTYLYTAASFAEVGPDWADFSGELTSTAFSASALQFRPETAFVKLIILANYQQPGEATELLWDDLTLEVVPPVGP